MNFRCILIPVLLLSLFSINVHGQSFDGNESKGRASFSKGVNTGAESTMTEWKATIYSCQSDPDNNNIYDSHMGVSQNPEQAIRDFVQRTIPKPDYTVPGQDEFIWVGEILNKRIITPIIVIIDEDVPQINGFESTFSIATYINNFITYCGQANVFRQKSDNSQEYEVNTPTTIYPNPFEDQLTVTNANKAPLDILVYNLQSQLMLQNTIEAENTTTISMQALPAGSYLIILENAEMGIKEVKKVAKF